MIGLLKRFFTALCIGALFCGKAWAQDPLFTQFYAAPLYLNPAFAGSTGEGRIIANYRNQWPGIDANFVTYAASYDQYFARIRSSFGAIIKRDEQGGGSTAPLISTDASLIYAYMIPLNDKFVVQAGLSAGYGFRDLNFNRFIFGDQLSDDGPTGGGTTEAFLNERRGYFDSGTGLVLYSNQLWVGVSLAHLNSPNLSFTGETDFLPRRFSAHAGYKIPFKKLPPGWKRERDESITPAIMYLSQGAWDQLSIGSYINFEPLVFGVWYRGIPLKATEFRGVNQDALAFELGFQLDNLSIGYSYDYTVSRLSNVNTLGAHEISIIYNIRQKERGPSKGFGYPPVTCPNPWRKYQRLPYKHVQ